jgi:hypothetical protein
MSAPRNVRKKAELPGVRRGLDNKVEIHPIIHPKG